MALLEVKNIYKSFGGVKAIQDFSLAADAGQIHGIIGPNGAGKTTIFNVISGVYPADQGTDKTSRRSSSTRLPAWGWAGHSRISACSRA